MAFRLKNLRLGSIALVDKGASGDHSLRPQVLIAKRDGDTPAPTKGKAMSFFSKVFGRKVEKELPDPGKMLDDALADLPEEKKQVVLAAVQALIASGGKSAPAPAPAPAPDAGGEKKPDDMAKAAQAAVEAQLAPIKKQLEDKDAEIKKLRDQVDKGAADVAKANIEKRTAEITKRVSALKHTPGKHEEIVKDLVEVETKAGTDAAEKSLKRLEDTNALLAKSRVFHPGEGGGPNGEGEGGEGTVTAKLEKSIKEHIAAVRKSGAKRVPSREQAFKACWAELSGEEKQTWAEENNQAA